MGSPGMPVAMAALLTLLLVSPYFLSLTSGHGMITDPPARNAMWRYGYTNPVNYNDNELYCGGFSVQWNQNEGKCGVCGDNFAEAEPRPHEAGGRYGNGIIGRRFEIHVEFFRRIRILVPRSVVLDLGLRRVPGPTGPT